MLSDLRSNNSVFKKIKADVGIIGAGPAGILLALQLAKKNISVILIEQHQDFSREYRGELLMPRFSELFSQIDLLDYILEFPHTKLDKLEMYHGPTLMGEVALSEIDPGHPHAIWMAQPVLLEALRKKASAFPSFRMEWKHSILRLIQENGKTSGFVAQGPEGEVEVKCKITVGADGRSSRLRKLGNFSLRYEYHDFDVLWFSLPRPNDYPNVFRMYYSPERSYVISPKHPNQLQCGLLAYPHEFSSGAEHRLSSIREALYNGPKFLHNFADHLKDVREFFRLQAKLAYVDRWAQEGLLLIGDAAHTCSPVGAVGVSLAMETAVLAAEVITEALSKQDSFVSTLDKVQKNRGQEIRRIHFIQRLFAHAILAKSKGVRRLLSKIIPLAAKSGIPQKLHQKLIFNKRSPVL